VFKESTYRESGLNPERPRRCNERQGLPNLDAIAFSLQELARRRAAYAQSQKTYQRRVIVAREGRALDRVSSMRLSRVGER
jgi:hypothetical protein